MKMPRLMNIGTSGGKTLSGAYRFLAGGIHKLFILTILLFLNSPANAQVQKRKKFCQHNPTSILCTSRLDERDQRVADTKEECRLRPNTEKCKNIATRKKIKDERLTFCESNPAACAGRRR